MLKGQCHRFASSFMWLLVNAPPPPLFKTPPDFIIWMSCGGDDDMFEQCMYINPIKLSFAYNRIKIFLSSYDVIWRSF